jgi:hypothetical protein
MLHEALRLQPNTAEDKPFRVDGLPFALAYAKMQRKQFRKDRNVQNLARCADAITVCFTDFVAGDAVLELSPFQKQSLNVTALANVAYISLHATDPTLRQQYADLLKELY